MVATMSFGRFAALPMAAALLLGINLVAAGAAEWDRVNARFEIYGFAGLHVLTTRTSVEETSNRYAIAMDIDTRGLASVFVDLSSRSEVHGTLIGDRFRPEAYRAEVRRNGIDRYYNLDYGGDGAVTNVAAPLSAERPFFVAPEQLRGTVDQLTAYFILEHQVVRRGTCALVVRVFDGAGFYNLRFTDVKRETLSADSHQNFAGPTQVCQVVRDEIIVNRNPDEDTYQRGKIWYARLTTGNRMIPVRMEYDTAFGVVRGYLAELRGPGIDLRLMGE
jgi:Protein of unknown function (DUF3108)